MLRILSSLLIIIISLLGCSDSTKEGTKTKDKLKNFNITIDWVPSPEYYGFFYAKEKGLYEAAGFDVNIAYGKGAPSVALQVASNAIYAGTTTSDNILRQLARGAQFSKVTPLLTYNPSVIASRADSPIKSLSELRGKIIGTNPESNVYQQFKYFLNINNMTADEFKEFPIGYGGDAQLENKQVDAILAYTTNVVVNLEVKGLKVHEIFLGDQGVPTYGLVMVFGSKEALDRAGISSDDISRFIDATIKGYVKGSNDVKGAIEALTAKEVAPTLDKTKLKHAIEKIAILNGRVKYPLEAIDNWVDDKEITPDVRKRAQALYK